MQIKKGTLSLKFRYRPRLVNSLDGSVSEPRVIPFSGAHVRYYAHFGQGCYQLSMAVPPKPGCVNISCPTVFKVWYPSQTTTYIPIIIIFCLKDRANIWSVWQWNAYPCSVTACSTLHTVTHWHPVGWERMVEDHRLANSNWSRAMRGTVVKKRDWDLYCQS